jgi:hypothetical protein
MKLEGTETEVKSVLVERKKAYQFTFNKEDMSNRLALQDMAKFCFAAKSTFDPDPRIHALREGRREVWLRISQYLNLTDDEIWNLTYRKL